MATPDTTRWQHVVADGESTGVAVRLDERNQRVLLGLSFLEGRKVVDVSVDPSSWVRCVHRAAREIYEPHTRWADALETGLRRTGADRGWWNELPEHLEPELTATAAAWPLMRPAIAAGFQERAVPRWAIPLLSATDVATGTRAVLGGRADRRVIREMARALSGPVRWWPIAWAIALPQLDAGRVGDLLASSNSTYRCTKDEQLLLATTLRRAHPDAVRRLLTSADDDGGPARLLAALDGWKRIPTAGRRVPNRLDRLETLVLAELEVAPPPPPPAPAPAPARPQREVARAVATARPPVRQVPVPVEQPPPQRALDRFLEQRQQVAEPCRIEYTEPYRQLHRARSGSVELVLPATTSEVERWGLALDNCIAIYAGAATQNRVVLVGIRHEGRLVGALSIDVHQGEISQIEAAGNRLLPEALHDQVVALVHELGVLNQ